jgi:sulfur carrier protein
VVVIVNGQSTEIAEGASVETLLGDLGLDRRWVLVERNLEAVERRRLADTTLVGGDRIEIVRAVAGG